MIRFFNDDIDVRIRDKNRIKTWLKEVADSFGFTIDEINIISCSDERITEINVQFLNHDYATDIITFDHSTGKAINGELYLGIETIKENAEDNKVTFQSEAKRVIVHGLLHMIGFKDKTDKEKEQMRKAENDALALFHVKQK